MAEEAQTTDKMAVPIQDVYSPQEASCLLGIKVNKLYEMARQTEDPFPLRRLKGRFRGSIVFRDEMIEWARRNFVMISNRRK